MRTTGGVDDGVERVRDLVGAGGPSDAELARSELQGVRIDVLRLETELRQARARIDQLEDSFLVYDATGLPMTAADVYEYAEALQLGIAALTTGRTVTFDDAETVSDCVRALVSEAALGTTDCLRDIVVLLGDGG
ncbi:MAG: hypothetical protein QF664_07650 [Dehalococcoidia bacterium]|nr:hypothetical protein [Dehalococcoidia bacterium]